MRWKIDGPIYIQAAARGARRGWAIEVSITLSGAARTRGISRDKTRETASPGILVFPRPLCALCEIFEETYLGGARKQARWSRSSSLLRFLPFSCMYRATEVWGTCREITPAQSGVIGLMWWLCMYIPRYVGEIGIHGYVLCYVQGNF